MPLRLVYWLPFNIVFGARPDVGGLTKGVRSCARDNLMSKGTSSAAA
jgi:hypothetical protein